MKIVSVAVLLFCSAFALAQQIKLEYIFKVGDEYTMTQVMKQTMKQTIMGMEQNGESANSGVVKFKVLELTKTGARIETQFLKLMISSKTMLGDMAMDSEGDEGNNQNKIFKSMMNKSFFVFMNKTGKIETVEEDENLWTGIDESTLDQPTKASLKILKQQFSKNSLKNSIEQAMIQYSQEKVKPGDNWKALREFPMDLPIQSEQVWTLTSLKGGSAKIGAEGVVITTDKDKAFTLPIGVKAKADLKGKQLVNSNVNTKTGWARDLSIRAEISGKMLILAGGMLPMDMETPIEILAETTYQIIKNK